MVENHIVNLAQFLIVQTVQLGTPDVFRGIGKAIVSEHSVIRHKFFLPDGKSIYFLLSWMSSLVSSVYQRNSCALLIHSCHVSFGIRPAKKPAAIIYNRGKVFSNHDALFLILCLFVGGEILDLLSNTGPVAKFVLVTLLAFSLISWAIILTKWSLLRRARIQSGRFLRAFRKAQRLQDIAAVCRSISSQPAGRSFRRRLPGIQAPTRRAPAPLSAA